MEALTNPYFSWFIHFPYIKLAAVRTDYFSLIYSAFNNTNVREKSRGTLR